MIILSEALLFSDKKRKNNVLIAHAKRIEFVVVWGF
jgi:hypothetical protein